MYDVANNATPVNISSLFTNSSRAHDCNTRFTSSGNFQIKHLRTNYA